MTGLELAAGVAISGALGALSKHKTKLPHKATGTTQNVVVGQAAAALLGGSPEDGLKIAIITEAALNAGKSVFHGGRTVFHGARTLLGLIRRLR
jgi:hypothetical protein